MTETYSFFVFSDEQLASTVAGASGAKKIGVSSITGLTASDVQAALEQLAAAAPSVPPASETVQGKVELATDVETQTGTDTTRAVHPSGLASLTGTETRRGLLELATTAEAQAGTDTARAVHPGALKATLDSRLTVEAWQTPTLTNSWVNYGAPFESAGYYKDPLGVVWLRGTVKNGTLGAAVFTLPTGYRPANDLPFAPARADGQTNSTRVEVRSNGNVVITQGASAETSFNGIAFRV